MRTLERNCGKLEQLALECNVGYTSVNSLHQEVWLIHCQHQGPLEMPFHRRAKLTKENPENTKVNYLF